jgi:hypothetical protein
MAMIEISFEDAKKIATSKGLLPSRVKGTENIQFTKGQNNRLEVIDWEEFEQMLKTRQLAIYESGGWMKIMSRK